MQYEATPLSQLVDALLRAYCGVKRRCTNSTGGKYVAVLHLCLVVAEGSGPNRDFLRRSGGAV